MTDRAADLLSRVVSWETFPPTAGTIRFRSADSAMLAAGRFRVILAYGPGAKYTMAWAIDAYRAVGIPVVPRGLRAEPAVHEPATRDAALAHARRITVGTAGVFPFWAGDVLLEVSDLTTAGSGEAAAPPPLISLPVPVEPVVDRELAGAEKQAILSAVERIGIRPRIRTALIFVLQNDEDELELSRNDVAASDVAPLTRAYWLMPAWTQRVGVAYLLQDHGAAPEAIDVWFDVLRAPDLGPDSVRHVVKAAALGWLRGDISAMDRYLDDYQLTRAHGRVLAQLTGRR
jgi:hypothetical protein